MRAITIRISDLQLRLAILYAVFQSLRTVSTLAIGIALIAGVVALDLQGMVGATLFSSVTAGILVGLMGWIALNAVLFAVNVKTANRIWPSPQNTPLTYLFTNEGCKISKGDVSKSIPRENFRRLLRRPSMSLLEVVGTHPRHELGTSSPTALHPHFARSFVVMASAEFPIVSLFPASLRSFLILPAASFGREEIAFIAQMLHNSNDV